MCIRDRISPQDVLEVYTTDGVEVSYRVLHGESSDELVILSTEDMAGQELHVRLSGKSKLNQRGSIYTGDFESGMLSSDWIMERQVGESGLSSLIASPNPFDQSFVLSGSYDEAASIEMSIYTSSGQLIKSQSIQLSSGYNLERIDANSLTPGVYLVELKSQSSSVMHKLIKQ